MAPAPPVEAVSAPRRGGFLRDALTLAILAGVAKLAGALKSTAVAAAYGSSPELDNYLLAFLLPSMLADTFCGAIVPVAVPALIESRHRAGREASIELYCRLLRKAVRGAVLGAGIIAVGIAAFLEFSGALRRANAHSVAVLALLMLPVIPSNAVANVWRAVLNSQERFAVPAIAVVLTPAAIALAALTTRHEGTIRVLAVATTTGAALELAVLALAVHAAGFPLLPRIPQLDAGPYHPSEFRAEYGFLASSGAVSGASAALGQAMAASLGAGAVSTLNYGTRLSGVLMSLGPAALGVAVLPRFAQMAAERAWKPLRTSLRRLLLLSLAATGAATCFAVLFSTPIVRIALQHGAFNAADTLAVSRVQAWSLVQVPFITGISILMRMLVAVRASRVLLPFSAGALALNAALNYVLMHRYGVAGISCAASLTQALMFLGLASLVFATGDARKWAKENR